MSDSRTKQSVALAIAVAILGGGGAAAFFTGGFGLLGSESARRHEDAVRVEGNRISACQDYAGALSDVSSAIAGVTAQIETQGEGEAELPVRTLPGYGEAQKAFLQTGKTLSRAAAGFSAAGLTVADEVSWAVTLQEVTKIIEKLPAKVRATPTSELRRTMHLDIGALPDRASRFDHWSALVIAECGS